MRAGPIYENRVFVDPDVADDYDAWIAARIADVTDVPGVVETNTFALAVDPSGRPGRAAQFALDDEAGLEDFIDGFATDLEAEAIEKFGDAINWQERILREDVTRELPAGEMPECLNCGAHMRGQYCGQCGQRARGRLISLWELIRDAFGDLFELDSRLWHDNHPVAFSSPACLTARLSARESARVSCRRFRMYLVLSLLFFVVAFFDPREELRHPVYEPDDARRNRGPASESRRAGGAARGRRRTDKTGDHRRRRGRAARSGGRLRGRQRISGSND